MAAIIAIAALTGGAGTAVAQDIEECTDMDEFLWTFTAGLSLIDQRLAEHCDPTDLSDGIQNLQNQTEDLSELEIYNALTSQGYNSQQLEEMQDAYLQDTRTHSFTIGEDAAVESIQNETSRAEMNSSVSQAVSEYYSKNQQERLVNSWNSALIAWFDSLNKSQTSGLRDDTDSVFLGSRVGGGDGGGVGVVESWPDQETAEPVNQSMRLVKSTTVTLADGRSVDAYSIEVTYKGGDASTLAVENTTIGEGIPSATSEAAEDYTWQIDELQAIEPDGSTLGNQTVIDFESYDNRWNAISSNSTLVQDNVKVYANNLYDEYSAGTFQPANHTSAATQASQWAADYDDTGYWSYAAAFTAGVGFDSPDLNNTGLINVSTGTNSYQGLIFSDAGAPNGSWDAGETYDPSATDGDEFMITEDGERITFDSPYTIEEMQDKDGETINSTTTVEYVYQSTNVSDYEALQQEIETLRTEIQSREIIDGGGGGGGIEWPSLGGGGGVIVIIAAAAALLLARS